MSERAYFEPEVFGFLRQLKRNNKREWFEKNRSRYDQIIRDPALAFIAAFAGELPKLSPHFVADPRPTRGSLFRIYRDTRFSADKKPYKTHVGITFRHDSGKDVHAPLFYLHLEPENCFAAAGIWHPDSPTQTKVRAAIVRDPEGWRKVRRKIELEGDRLTRPPRGYDPNHPLVEDIKFKDFVSSVPFTEEQICGQEFMRDYVAACRSMAPLVEFTTKALGLKY